MKSRINIKYFNLLLIIAVAFVIVLALVLDLSTVLKTTPLQEIGFLLPDMSTIHDVVMTILDVMAAATFLYMAYKYNGIRKKKSDKYLSSLIFYSAIYLGISWLLELLVLDFVSDIRAFTDIAGKFYMPLSIFSGLFLSYVAYEVFIEPTLAKDKTDPLVFFVIPSAIVGMVVGSCILFFVYTPDLSPFEVIVSATGFALFGIMIIILGLTVFRINRIKKTAEIEARQPLNSISVQLLLIIAIIFLVVIVEMGSVTGLPQLFNHYLRFFRAICCIVVAVLYYFSFIKPSR